MATVSTWLKLPWTSRYSLRPPIAVHFLVCCSGTYFELPYQIEIKYIIWFWNHGNPSLNSLTATQFSMIPVFELKPRGLQRSAEELAVVVNQLAHAAWRRCVCVCAYANTSTCVYICGQIDRWIDRLID